MKRYEKKNMAYIIGAVVVAILVAVLYSTLVQSNGS